MKTSDRSIKLGDWKIIQLGIAPTSITMRNLRTDATVRGHAAVALRDFMLKTGHQFEEVQPGEDVRDPFVRIVMLQKRITSLEGRVAELEEYVRKNKLIDELANIVTVPLDEDGRTPWGVKVFEDLREEKK